MTYKSNKCTNDSNINPVKYIRILKNIWNLVIGNPIVRSNIKLLT